MNDMFDSYSKFSINTAKIFPHPMQCFFIEIIFLKQLNTEYNSSSRDSLIVINFRFKIEHIIIAVKLYYGFGKTMI